MRGSSAILEKTIGASLLGKGSHVATRTIFDGLGWKAAGARPQGAPHSVFQLLNHLNYWQDWVVKWLAGGNPKVPKHASGGWPGGVAPASAKEWQQTVRAFKNGLAQLERESRQADLMTMRGTFSRLGMIQAVASHTSHHAGQVVLLRQMLGTWPPPSGGVTW